MNCSLAWVVLDYTGPVVGVDNARVTAQFHYGIIFRAFGDRAWPARYRGGAGYASGACAACPFANGVVARRSGHGAALGRGRDSAEASHSFGFGRAIGQAACRRHAYRPSASSHQIHRVDEAADIDARARGRADKGSARRPGIAGAGLSTARPTAAARLWLLRPRSTRAVCVWRAASGTVRRVGRISPLPLLPVGSIGRPIGNSA
jgi:hypothetical protein